MRAASGVLLALSMVLLGGDLLVTTETSAQPARDLRNFALPTGDGPIVVRASFDLREINEIDDGNETFEFTGVLTLTWQDPRNAFDPAIEGVAERVLVGDYQFNEVLPGWYPQVTLANESGLYQQSGVVQRVQPDGTSTLIQTVNAIAEAEFSMYRFPVDHHRLDAVFEVLGFGADEVALEVASPAAGTAVDRQSIPQWTVEGTGLAIRDWRGSSGSARESSSALVLSVDVRRNFYYTARLVVLPLIVIVLLSFSVFWMDRSSLSDRLNVSFIGILTAVAYQLVTSEQLPRIAYITLMHGFLSISFLTMCATVVISLIVSTMYKRGRDAAGAVIDRRSRWAFPLAYFGIIGMQVATAFLFF